MSRAGVGRALAGAALGSVLCAASAPAGTFSGAATLELEYLGESYWSRQTFSAADLGLPSGTVLFVSDTTRFADDSWLPGPRIDLRWQGGSAAGVVVDIASHTEANAERVQEALELDVRLGDPEEGRWRARALAGVREEERSLVGHGDWKAALELSREARLSGALFGLLRAGLEHSRTRGDTTSYLYDYELWNARAALRGGDSWLHTWEAFAEASAKETAGGLPGSYREVRAGGAWLPDGGLRSLLDLELTWRDYEGDSVGRDEARLETSWRGRLAGGAGAGLDAEVRGTWTDVAGSDEIYFDAAQVELELPWSTGEGAWSGSAGPVLESLWDLEDGSRDYRQGGLRVTGSRRLAAAGFMEVDVTGGRRDYTAAGSDVVEISSLSASFLRSDYWLLDLLVLVAAPVAPLTTLDVLGSFAWEFHDQDSERIQVSFFTAGVTRRF